MIRLSRSCHCRKSSDNRRSLPGSASNLRRLGTNRFRNMPCSFDLLWRRRPLSTCRYNRWDQDRKHNPALQANRSRGYRFQCSIRLGSFRNQLHRQRNPHHRRMYHPRSAGCRSNHHNRIVQWPRRRTPSIRCCSTQAGKHKRIPERRSPGNPPDAVPGNNLVHRRIAT